MTRLLISFGIFVEYLMFPAAFSKLCLKILMEGTGRMYCHQINLGYSRLNKVIPSDTEVSFPHLQDTTVHNVHCFSNIFYHKIIF